MSKLQEAIKALESLRCPSCGGRGLDGREAACLSCLGSGVLRDHDDLINQILETQLENIALTCKHYLDMNAPRSNLAKLLLKIQ